MFKNKYWKVFKPINLLFITLLFIVLFGIGFFVYSIYDILVFGTLEERVAIYIIVVAIIFVTWIRKMIVDRVKKGHTIKYRITEGMKELAEEISTIKKKIKFIDEFLVKYVKVDKDVKDSKVKDFLDKHEIKGDKN